VSIRSICLSEDRIILNNTESDPWGHELQHLEPNH
jgi:hypothetical protein